jgi:hypothetical protein
MANSQVHQLQAEDSHRSHLNEPPTEENGNISMPNEISDQDDDTPLDTDALAKSRDKAFRKLSSEEKKVIITMQDPTGRKYSLPFFLVKTWDVSSEVVSLSSVPNFKSRECSISSNKPF